MKLFSQKATCLSSLIAGGGGGGDLCKRKRFGGVFKSQVNLREKSILHRTRIRSTLKISFDISVSSFRIVLFFISIKSIRSITLNGCI